VLDAYVELGRATGKEAEAEAWVRSSLEELEKVKAKAAAHTQGRPPVRVAFFEWIEPIYAAGNTSYVLLVASSIGVPPFLKVQSRWCWFGYPGV